jgi:hypothetical protein
MAAGTQSAYKEKVVESYNKPEGELFILFLSAPACAKSTSQIAIAQP